MHGWNRKTLLAIAISLGVLAVATLLILKYLPLPGNSLMWKELKDAGHTLLFGAIAILALLFVRRLGPDTSSSPRHAYVIAFVFVSGVAVLSEFMQYLTPRDADLEDFARDLAGAIAFLVLYALVDAKITARLPARIGLAVFSLALLGLAFFSALSWSAACFERDRQFPVLMDFSPRWHASYVLVNEAELSLVSAPEGFSDVAAKHVAQVRFGPGNWPGLTHQEPVRDWSQYKSFRFRVFNPDTETRILILRIEDRRHNGKYDDRYNMQFAIAPGTNAFNISLRDVAGAPTGRTLKLTRIASFSLFADHVEQPFVLYFDQVYLE